MTTTEPKFVSYTMAQYHAALAAAGIDRDYVRRCDTCERGWIIELVGPQGNHMGCVAYRLTPDGQTWAR